MRCFRPSDTVQDDRLEAPPRPLRTYREVAAIVGIHWTAAQQAEARALRKLAASPDLIDLWNEMQRPSRRR